MINHLSISQFGEDSIRISINSKEISRQVVEIARALRGSLPEAEVVGTASAILVIAEGIETESIEDVLSSLETTDPGESRVHYLPVVYDGEDLEEIATELGVKQTIALHAAATYRVEFLGFAPGFPYLSGTPKELSRMPRKRSPRQSVPAGSVAIASGWTGIYPSATPGGWNLIGKCATKLFDAANDPPSLLLPGDLVKFVPQ